MKAILIAEGKKEDSYQEFKKRILSEAGNLTEICDQVKVVITDQPPPRFSIIPFRKSKIASISIYSTEKIPIEVLELSHLIGGYKVEEALPVAYQKSWQDGEPTPGKNLLTLFRKKDGLDYDDFIHRWHNGHTPLSLKIHPLWNYNRNVVRSSLLDVSKWYDGIVEEQVKEDSELFNPFRFFGSPTVIIQNMLKVYFDVKGFIAYDSIETYLANEYWIKS